MRSITFSDREWSRLRDILSEEPCAEAIMDKLDGGIDAELSLTLEAGTNPLLADALRRRREAARKSRGNA